MTTLFPNFKYLYCILKIWVLSSLGTRQCPENLLEACNLFHTWMRLPDGSKWS